MSSSGGSRIAKKMEASISSGDFYSALQMAKSLYARKLAAKRRSDALSLLQDAASTMAAHGQVSLHPVVVVVVVVVVAVVCVYICLSLPWFGGLVVCSASLFSA